jgi:O-antigen/teichoic acid export membrane protein
MSRSVYLAKNTLIIGFGKVLSQVVVFLLLPIYTVFLSPEDYGIVDLIISYLSLAAPVIILQLDLGVFRCILDARGDKVCQKRILSSVFAIIAPVAAAILAIFAVLTFILSIPYGGLIILNIIAIIFSAIFTQFARGLGENIKFTISNIIISIGTAVGATILIVVFRWGGSGILLATAAAHFTACAYLAATLKIHRLISLKARDRAVIRQLLAYSAPLVPNTISWWLVNTSNRTIITLVLSATANGIFAIANKFAVIVNTFSAVFSISWMESASLHIKSPDRNQFFSETMGTALKITASVALCLIAVMPFIFPVFVGPEFADGSLYVPVLILGALMNAVVSFYSAIYIALKATRQVMYTTVTGAIINIIVHLGLIWLLGLWAAAISTVVAWTVMAIHRHIDITRNHNIHIKYSCSLLLILASLLIAISALYYWDNPFINILSLLVALTATAILNRKLLKAGWILVKQRNFKNI